MRFLDQLTQRYFSPKKVWGIHINQVNELHVCIEALLIEKDKNTLFIRQKRTLSSFEELEESGFQEFPVCISYDSPNILTRKVEEDTLDFIAEQLHTTNLKGFLFQSLRLEDHYQVYVIRRTIFEELTERLKKRGLNIVEMTLGPVNITTGMDYVSDVVDGCVKLLNYSILFKDGKLYSIERLADSDGHIVVDKIGGEVLKETELLPYCNALSLIIYGNELPYIGRKVWNAGLMEFAYQQLFKKAFPIILGSILFLLLGNFFLLQHYQGIRQALSLEYAGYQRVHDDLVELQAQFEDHKRMVSQVNLKHNVSFAYYADRIASSIKERALLTDLDIYPRKELRLGIEPDIEVENNVIRIKGICVSPVELSLWTNDLQKEAFVGAITKQTYQFDAREQIGRFSFVIKVKGNEVE